MATLIPTRKGWMQHAGESFTDYMDRMDKVFDTLKGVESGKSIVGRIIQFPVADNYARYVVKSESPFEIEHLPFSDGYRITDAYIRGLTVADVAPWLKPTAVAVKDFIYETVVRCGRMKNYRILNLSTGTLYSMDFDTLAEAIRGIEDGKPRAGKVVKYVPLQDIVNKLWTI